jgi:4-amino-4-deoxy-L-arabinose transferase-like glycosyltransferase
MSVMPPLTTVGPERGGGHSPVDATSSRGRSWLHALGHGRPSDPAWVRPTLVAVLLGTAVLYLWGLGASGWANSFYSAAVQAGSTSWKAFFFGSFDSASFITVDKPPAALWVMDLSARLFGVDPWSILVPQALEGVAAVGMLYLTVRRRFSAAAALLAGMVLAVTPVATLMFRFNNPDALLVLLLVAAVYAVVRALEKAGTAWLVLAAGLVGTAFLTKMLQAFIVVPVLALVYLVAAPTSARRRIGQLLLAGIALVVASGWWVAVVSLVPAADRPYIGGSQTNSVLELVLGYNGFGRLTGDESGSVGGAAAGTVGRWGATGWARLFGSEMGTQIAWLLPAALVLTAAVLWLLRRAPRTDTRRAQVLLWAGWLLVTGVVFSFAQGIIHPYYTVALAPAIAALVGIGAVSLWRLRALTWVRVTLAATVAGTALWSWELLGRAPDWYPLLRLAVLVGGQVAACLVLVAPRLTRRSTAGVAVLALSVSLAGPVAYSVDTAATPHSGAIPSAGPASTVGAFGPGRGGGPVGGAGGGPAGGLGGGLGALGGPGGQANGVGPGNPAGGGPGGTNGGLLQASSPGSALVAALRADASAYTWVAAVVGANSAAGYQLGSDEPVMAIGGFNGTDPSPTLAEFEALVTAGRIHYFIASGGGLGPGQGSGSGAASEITSWVERHFTARTVGGTTIYDLTASTG